MSLRSALLQAVRNRVDGIGTHIVLLPGTYRSTLIPEWTDDGPAPIVIEAAQSGTSIISGADVWSDWDCSGSICTRSWPYNWGVAPNPWAGDVDIGPLARRRELVVVNGTNLEQSESEAGLVAGSFYVDEGADRITVRLPDGVSPADATIEVGVRSRLFDSLHWPGVMVKGVVFEHAVPAFTSAGVLVGSGTALVDVTVRRSGQIGMYAEGEDISIWRSRFNENGGDGFLLVRIKGFEMVSSHSSYNNWRGARGGFDEWSVGQKIARVHDGRLIDHTAVGNWSRGVWLDWDNSNFTISGLTACNNRSDGLRIEGNQGPIVVEDSLICDNGQFGVSANGSRYVEFRGNRVEGNRRGALHFEGELRRVTSMDGKTYDVNLTEWSVTDNVVSGTGKSSLWSVAFFDLGARSRFFSTSTFDSNTYEQPDNARPFVLMGSGSATLSFDGWRTETGHDGSSTFN